MTDYTTLQYKIHDNIAYLTLNRPKDRNTLTRDMLNELQAIIRTIHNDSKLKAVIVTGSGADFCLGGDYGDFFESISRDDHDAKIFCNNLTHLLEKVILGIVSAPIPFIAAINGQAAGAGMSLALACDLRVAEPRTKLNIAYGMIGASTDGGMSWFLPRYAGFSAAAELLYTQPILRAARAQELSLVHRVSAPGELNACAEQLAKQIAGSASHPMHAIKYLLSTRYGLELENHMRAEHRLFAQGVTTIDFKNAVHAMQRGEIPSFD